jgi:surfactin synthase thioesterase subunit
MRLFCFPFAGGAATVFDAFAERLPERVEVCAVQYPGRQERAKEPAPRRMSQLVGALERELRPWLDRPFLLFGNSLGAVVAYEFARRLGNRGLPLPERLVVSSARAPHLPEPLPDCTGLSDAELAARLVALGTMPEEAARHPELLAVALPVLRADFELARSYRHRGGTQRLHVPFDAVRGADDESVPEGTVRAWAELTEGEFSFTPVPGGHGVLTAPGGELLAAVGDACARTLEREQRQVSASVPGRPGASGRDEPAGEDGNGGER